MRGVVIFFSILMACASYCMAQEESKVESSASDVPAITLDQALKQISELKTQNAKLESEMNTVKDMYSSSLIHENDLKDSIAELNRIISDARENYDAKLKAKDEEMVSYQKKYVTMASNFMYIPYEEYSINEIAIPAFESVKNTKFFSEYQIRYEILKHYFEDVNNIVSFLDSVVTSPSNMIDGPMASLRSESANQMKRDLEDLPLYSRYKAYDDWTNTFLGKYIVAIEKVIKNPDTDSKKILGKYKDKLIQGKSI